MNQPKQFLPLPKSLRDRYADDYVRRYRAQHSSRTRRINAQLREEERVWREKRRTGEV